MNAKLPDEQLLRFSEFVAETLGLYFPPSRWPDLQRGIAAAARSLGLDDAAAFARRCMSAPVTKNQLEALASSLTVGETYFFRESRTLEVFADHIVPELARARQGREQRLRIWSAACCTGEEPYSIAILLRRILPAWRDWNITVLATDVNPRFLRQAEAGVFGPWSFRGAPVWLKEQCLRPSSNGQFEILPEIKRMVRFAPLNLVEDAYPSPINDTNAMDVIFCRNVLLYFTPAQAKKVVGKLHRAQVDGGWLIVSPSELLHVSSSPYVMNNFQDVMLYRKHSINPAYAEPQRPPAQVLLPAADQSQEEPVAMDASSTAVVYPASLPSGGEDPAALGLRAHSLANQGKLGEALSSCDQWVATDTLDPSAHYLRAVILQEQGEAQEAVGSLRKALYLDPELVLAHFALGNIARCRGQLREADKHFANALRLLRARRSDEILPESDGISVGRFTEIIESLMTVESVS